MRFDVFDRIVPSIGVQHVDRVQAITAVAAAVAPGEEFHLDPEIVALLTGEDQAAAIAAASTDLVWHRFGKGLHHRV